MRIQYFKYLPIFASVFIGVFQLPAFADTATISETNVPANEPEVLSFVSIKTATSPEGEYLVDDRGMSLYVLDAGTEATSRCDTECEKAWPPFLMTSNSPLASGGAKASSIANIQRADGAKQVTYEGMPLYFFMADKVQGDMKGHGKMDSGGSWSLVKPDGTKLISSQMIGGSSRVESALSYGYGCGSYVCYTSGYCCDSCGSCYYSSSYYPSYGGYSYYYPGYYGGYGRHHGGGHHGGGSHGGGSHGGGSHGGGSHGGGSH